MPCQGPGPAVAAFADASHRAAADDGCGRREQPNHLLVKDRLPLAVLFLAPLEEHVPAALD